MVETKSTPVSRKMWFILIMFGIFGQIAWAVENMYFNVFVYETIAPRTSAVTLMVQVSGIVATITTLLAGALSDKAGNRRHFISIGYIIWGIITLSFAFITKDNTAKLFNITEPEKIIATTIMIVVVMDCVMTFFGSSANDAAFNAWVTDNTDRTNRGKVEGVLSALPLLALLVVAGGFGLIKEAIGYGGMFVVLGGMVTLAGIIGLFTIKDARVLARSSEGSYFKDIIYGFRPTVVMRNKMLYIVLITMGLFSISSQIYMPYLLIYMTEYLKFSVLEYSAVLGGVVLLAAIGAAFLGSLSDKIGKAKLLYIGIAIYIAGLVALFFIDSSMPKGAVLSMMGIFGLIMLIGSILLTILLNATIRDYTPEEQAGKFQGIRMIFFVLIPMFIGPAIGDVFNQRAAATDPATYTYYDTVAKVTANVPTPVLFIVAAAIALLVLIPLFYITPRLDEKGSKSERLLTKWGENLDKNKPLQEYPRPQLARDSYLNLNGIWEYAIIKKSEPFSGYQGEIVVPFAPESILSGVEKTVMPDDILYYKRDFELPESFIKDRVLLNFGAVDYECTIKVNGIEVGGHRGGYLPFTLDITAAAKAGVNTIEAEVTDPSDTGVQSRGKQRIGGGGIWYTPSSGIWQTVWLESVNSVYVKSVKITPDIDASTVTVIPYLSEERDAVVKVIEGDKVIAEANISSGEPAVIALPSAMLWSPEEPFLYDVEITADNDIVKSYFGMRKFGVGKDSNGVSRLMLNNKPYFHNGLLDQGYWSDGLYTAASDDALIFDVLRCKELGFNTLRKHIKIEPLRWYYHCDRLGILVWQDFVSGGGTYNPLTIALFPFLGLVSLNKKFGRLKDGAKNYNIFARKNAAGRQEFLDEIYPTIDLLYNSTSLALWVPFNEGWGQFDSVEVADIVRAYDSTRIIDHASGWHDQGGFDLNSFHIYFSKYAFPKNKEMLGGDDRPIALTEFGGFGYVSPEHTWNKKRIFGYRIYKDIDELTANYKKLFEKNIIPNIEQGLSAAIYTQVSDVEMEVNGLFTYDRKELKVDEATVRDLNARIKLID